jgi:RimJ/RimL family protein N-acetyltransferase
MIRETVPEDLDDFYRIYDESEAAKYLAPLSDDRQEEQEKLQAYIDFVYGFYGFGWWSVFEKKTGKLIGRCGLNTEQIEDEVLIEVGYLIEAEKRQQGLASEAMQAVMAYAREELGIEEFAACIAPDNTASIALALKLGLAYRKDVMREGKKLSLYTSR